MSRAFPRQRRREAEKARANAKEANSDGSLHGQTLSLDACNPYYEHPGAR
jgi:hypothetical protein